VQASELSDRSDPRVTAALCEALNNDADMTVRRAAAMASCCWSMDCRPVDTRRYAAVLMVT